MKRMIRNEKVMESESLAIGVTRLSDRFSKDNTQRRIRSGGGLWLI